MKFSIFGKVITLHVEDIDEGFAGLFIPDENKIKINSKYDKKFDTMLHEFLHAVWFRCGINQAQIPHEVQEIIVENFSVAISENFLTIQKLFKKLK